jgi:hypothetical protein
MPEMTYARFQYNSAYAIIREMRWLGRDTDHYGYLEEMLYKNIEKHYIQAAHLSLNRREVRTYEERPIYHRSENIGRVWARLREWRKKQGLEPNYPMDYI